MDFFVTITNIILKSGYYSSKGKIVIATTLTKLVIPNILTFDVNKPLKPIDYLREILILEVIIRLIIQDFNRKLSLEEARDVMKKSADFGTYIYNNNE
jgi:hypothetical protein